MKTQPKNVALFFNYFPYPQDNWMTDTKTGNPYWKGRLNTINLLIKMACFVKKEKYISVLKAAELNQLNVQGGHPYWSFRFSKDSLVDHINLFWIKTNLY